jgi:hypothetical protein
VGPGPATEVGRGRDLGALAQRVRHHAFCKRSYTGTPASAVRSCSRQGTSATAGSAGVAAWSVVASVVARAGQAPGCPFVALRKSASSVSGEQSDRQVSAGASRPCRPWLTIRLTRVPRIPGLFRRARRRRVPRPKAGLPGPGGDCCAPTLQCHRWSGGCSALDGDAGADSARASARGRRLSCCSD